MLDEKTSKQKYKLNKIMKLFNYEMHLQNIQKFEN